jgi:hypothetical protein
MGWEKRGKDGKRLVYYRKTRVGERVVSIYCGSGERGRAAEREDQERREGAKPPESPVEVLQGATPDASEGATPQVIEKAQDAVREPEYDWRRFLPKQPPPPRRYRK